MTAFLPFIQSFAKYDPALVESIIAGYTAIMESGDTTLTEGSAYIKNTVEQATAIYDTIINLTDREWNDHKILLSRDDHYIAYRFDEIGGIKRFVVMADRKRGNGYRGIYGTMKATNDPAIVLPMVDDDMWNMWDMHDFVFAPDDIKSRLRAMKPTTIHEITHMIDDKVGGGYNKFQMSDKSAQKLVPEYRLKNWEYDGLPDKVVADEVQYVNKPTEFNARFIAGVENAINMGHTKSFADFSRSMRENTQIGSVLHVLTPDNKKRYQKWLYQAYEIIKAKI